MWARLRAAALEAAGHAAPADRGLLWRLTRDGRSSYLFGTLHVGKPAWREFGPRTAAGWRASDLLALEIDATDPEVGAALAVDAALVPAAPDEVQVLAEQSLAQLEDYERWCECAANDEERAFLRRLDDERNPGLAGHIAALHGEGRRVFAAVGTLHMTGAQALPALPAARGFRVERVKFAR